MCTGTELALQAFFFLKVLFYLYFFGGLGVVVFLFVFSFVLFFCCVFFSFFFFEAHLTAETWPISSSGADPVEGGVKTT